MTDDRFPVLTRVLDNHPEVELAILYGSLAKGTAGPDSDLDIAVMGDHLLSAEASLALLRALASSTGRPVDLVDLRTTHGTLLGEILQTGVRIVETNSTLYPAVLSRHLLDEADFRPYRDRILTDRRRAWIAE